MYLRRQSLSQKIADQVIAADQNDPNIDPVNRIFRSISKEQACTVRNSMSRKEPLSWNLYLKLMEKYFGEGDTTAPRQVYNKNFCHQIV